MNPPPRSPRWAGSCFPSPRGACAPYRAPTGRTRREGRRPWRALPGRTRAGRRPGRFPPGPAGPRTPGLRGPSAGAPTRTGQPLSRYVPGAPARNIPFACALGEKRPPLLLLVVPDAAQPPDPLLLRNLLLRSRRHVPKDNSPPLGLRLSEYHDDAGPRLVRAAKLALDAAALVIHLGPDSFAGQLPFPAEPLGEEPAAGSDQEDVRGGAPGLPLPEEHQEALDPDGEPDRGDPFPSPQDLRQTVVTAPRSDGVLRAHAGGEELERGPGAGVQAPGPAPA